MCYFHFFKKEKLHIESLKLLERKERKEKKEEEHVKRTQNLKEFLMATFRTI